MCLKINIIETLGYTFIGILLGTVGGFFLFYFVIKPILILLDRKDKLKMAREKVKTLEEENKALCDRLEQERRCDQ